MDFDAQMWAPSVASEYVAVDMEAVTEMAEDIMGEVFTDVLEVQ